MLVLKDNIALNLNHFVLILALDTHTLILTFLYSYSYSPLGTLKSSSDLIYVIYGTAQIQRRTRSRYFSRLALASRSTCVECSRLLPKSSSTLRLQLKLL